MTGGCGFIGSNLVDRLLSRGGCEVIIIDNLSTGQMRFAETAIACDKVEFHQLDVREEERLVDALKGCSEVYHLAANADVRFGADHPRKDLEHNTIATFNVLEAMRANGIKRIAFASTGSIYGEPSIFPTPEVAPFPVQTSFYGASKLAGEALIQAYCENFEFQAYIFRFVSILGERYSHGHVFDFYRSLRQNPNELHILGNGGQRKSYLYVQDCIDAMFTAMSKSNARLNVFNLGSENYCQVDDSIEWITSYLGIDPVRHYTGGERGWVGDSPFIFLDTTKIRSLGWRSKLSIRDAVIRTLEYLAANPWLVEARS